MMKGKRLNNKGFTLIEMLIVLALIGAVIAVMLSVLNLNSSDKAKANSVVDTMREISQAIVKYHLDKNAWPTNFSDLFQAGYLKTDTPKVPGYENGGKADIYFRNPNCTTNVGTSSQPACLNLNNDSSGYRDGYLSTAGLTKEVCDSVNKMAGIDTSTALQVITDSDTSLTLRANFECIKYNPSSGHMQYIVIYPTQFYQP